jgi:hypothetical protein
MSNIPEARRRLIGIAEDLEKSRFMRQLAKRIREATALLDRKPPIIPKTEVESREMTQEIANKVKIELKKPHRLSHRKIAQKYEINQGRVTDVAAGEWGPL